MSSAVKEEMTETSADAALSPADALYEKCAQRPTGQIFFQRDLCNMNVANTMAELTVLLRELCDCHLLKLMTFEGDPCWKLRTREEADKIRRLTPDERLLYHHIDQVQTDGIWSKALRNKTNVTQQTLTKCLKSLEAKDLVQSVMSVKYPNRKMYLLKHLKPSEDIAGGIWQTDGEYDAALIEAISGAVAKYIEQETCIRVPANWNDYEGKGAVAQNDYDRTAAVAQKKASVLSAVQDIEEAPAVRSYTPPKGPKSRLVHRHKPHYPTVDSVAEWLNSRELIKDKTAKIADMEQLLEKMENQDRVEKVSGTNYRTVLRNGESTESKVYNGFVDAPCGTCPVFDQCGDEGEITARTCVYFAEWLGTESEEY
ncbi:dna-directed rna polymerase iii protein [Pyrenophora teres f. maculata]|nr:dna-directed rna polymerase iii protein [Pyrenophora teres f. maculata]